MAKDLFYLSSYKNVDKLFEKIEAAKAPDVFTNTFLTDTIGLKSTSDRPLINMLKKMGFLDSTGRPTETYGLLKNKSVAKIAIADGVRKVYAPLFEANEKANELTPDDLKGLIAQITGGEKSVVKQIAYTYAAMAKGADFTKSAKPEVGKENENGATRQRHPSHQFPRADCALTFTSIFKFIFLRTAMRKHI